jgi:hypothetical protein
MEATRDVTYRPIVDATRLLVFFATPHQGGNYASFGDIVAKVVRASTRNPSNDLLNNLKRDSDMSHDRFRQFRHQQDKYLVVSFSEGKSYHGLGIVRCSPPGPPQDPPFWSLTRSFVDCR